MVVAKWRRGIAEQKKTERTTLDTVARQTREETAVLVNVEYFAPEILAKWEVKWTVSEDARSNVSVWLAWEHIFSKWFSRLHQM